MVDRSTRLRWRRVFRRKQKQVGELGVQAEQNVERLVIRRLGRLVDVRRFVAGWLALVFLLVVVLVGQFRMLNRSWQSQQPVPGGVYTEGMMGTFTNANPLYATSLADTTVSHLLFPGLLKYDEHNALTTDLAESWTISEDNLHYTVVLRPAMHWQDGQPLTADDVVFTFQTAQNSDARSPLFRSWNGVQIAAKDERTIEFTLASPFAPFPHSLTTGIVPKHLLSSVPASDLRSATFNTTRPVGSGPFAWSSVEQATSGDREGEQQIGLTASDNYYAGIPKLDSFVIHTYRHQDTLERDFQDKKITAIVGLDDVPRSIRDSASTITYEPALTAQVMAFLRTDSKLLSDKQVRQALVSGTNVPQLVNELHDPVAVTNSPLLRGQSGYDAKLTQLGYDKTAAEKLLDKAGWKSQTDGGPRRKQGNGLSIRLVAQSTPKLKIVAGQLQRAWRDIGVDVSVSLLDETDIQAAIRDRNYDVLLYGISVGADPDVFAYWHSTQADPRSGSRLNFSDYSSKTADAALEAGRSRSDAQLRAVKYKPFLKAWRDDAPAVALYQPKFIYITNTPVFGFDSTDINTASDRLENVANWQIHQALRPRP